VSQRAGAAPGHVSSAKKVTRAPSSSVEPAAASACWYGPAWKRTVAPAHAGGTGAVPVAVRPGRARREGEAAVALVGEAEVEPRPERHVAEQWVIGVRESRLILLDDNRQCLGLVAQHDERVRGEVSGVDLINDDGRGLAWHHAQLASPPV
jgi:hypothetical protein